MPPRSADSPLYPRQAGNAAALLLVGLLLSAVTVLALYFLGVSQGEAQARQDYEATFTRLNQLHEQALQEQQAHANRTQQLLLEETHLLQTTLQEQQAHAKQKFADYERRLRNGTVRVSVPIVAGSARCDGAAPGDPGPGDPAAHAQLEPAAAADLAAIAHDGDAAIRDLNACIAQYNTVRTGLKAWADGLSTPDDVQAH